MIILALESSASPASVAVYEKHENGGKLLGQYYQNTGLSHSRTLMAMTQMLLENLDIKPDDIELYAAANGPGSFTGIRIGVSAVKGMALGIDKKVCAVSTLEAMAYQTCRRVYQQEAGSNASGIICPVMDARRNQVYNALFRDDGGTPVRICDDRAVSIEELAEELLRLDEPFMPIGDGAYLLINEARGNKNLKIIYPNPLGEYQTAYGVALAAVNTEPVNAADFEPVYLRPSQAERVREEKINARDDDMLNSP